MNAGLRGKCLTGRLDQRHFVGLGDGFCGSAETFDGGQYQLSTDAEKCQKKISRRAAQGFAMSSAANRPIRVFPSKRGGPRVTFRESLLSPTFPKASTSCVLWR